MKRSLTIVFLAGYALLAQAPAPLAFNYPTAAPEAVGPSVDCSALAGLSLKSEGAAVTVETSVAVPDALPAGYCRVVGVIAPAIRFEIHLPLTKWTQRYVQNGCGGLCGNISGLTPGRADGCAPVTNGEVATGATDMGHSGGQGDPKWASDNPQAKIDFAYRGEHLTAVTAKALIQKYYGRAAKYTYFSGCSDGGREALMEAQRYPGDFNGIAAGAPAMNFITQNTFYHGWNGRQNMTDDGKPILLADRLPILHNAAVAACDELDGLKDGLISYPPACHFDPTTIVCKPGQDPATCLTSAEANVAKEIYRGAHDAKGQQLVISGPQYGSELNWSGVYVPQGPTGNTMSPGMAQGVVRYIAYEKASPDFLLKDFKFDQATFDAIAPMHRIYDSTDPDLTKFAAAGGKLILYHGWSDPHISPLNTIAYYTAMQKIMGESKVSQFSRMFLFPGGSHCNGGDGPFDAPLLSALMSWVEKSSPPQMIVASHSPQTGRGGRGARGPAPTTPAPPPAIDRTRPVYAYPMIAKYKGSGSIDDASNFTIAPGAKLDASKLAWLGSKFFSAKYEQWCEWSGTAMNCGTSPK